MIKWIINLFKLEDEIAVREQDKFIPNQSVYATYYQTRLPTPFNATIKRRDSERREHFFEPNLNGKSYCDWYWIIPEGQNREVLFPETCLQDCIEYADNMDKYLKANEHRIGEKGFDIISWAHCEDNSKRARQYALNNKA